MDFNIDPNKTKHFRMIKPDYSDHEAWIEKLNLFRKKKLLG